MLMKYPSISIDQVKTYPNNRSSSTSSLVHSPYIYETAMVGKWHLGHAQRKMTPIGKGFDSFTGMYMWDIDSYTKQMYELPWEPPIAIDWIRDNSDGIYEHYVDDLHAMEVISTTTEDIIRQHAIRNPYRYAKEFETNDKSNNDIDTHKSTTTNDKEGNLLHFSY